VGDGPPRSVPVVEQRERLTFSDTRKRAGNEIHVGQKISGEPGSSALNARGSECRVAKRFRIEHIDPIGHDRRLSLAVSR
jgi:hypothetical protein